MPFIMAKNKKTLAVAEQQSLNTSCSNKIYASSHDIKTILLCTLHKRRGAYLTCQINNGGNINQQRSSLAELVKPYRLQTHTVLTMIQNSTYTHCGPSSHTFLSVFSLTHTNTQLTCNCQRLKPAITATQTDTAISKKQTQRQHNMAAGNPDRHPLMLHVKILSQVSFSFKSRADCSFNTLTTNQSFLFPIHNWE